MTAIVIAGAGECGTRAAFALREEGWNGRVILAGAEPSPPYERPPLSKTGELKPICHEDALREAGITFLPGTEVAGLDTAAHVLELAGGQRLAYRSLLLATGARARRLPFGGAPVHVLRTRADSAALRERLRPGRRVAVIGGGFIGLELASSAAALGCTVTVVELGPRLMGRAVPARVAAVMAERHIAAGVDIRCGTGVTGLAQTASGVALTLAEGPTVEADVVVAGVGAMLGGTGPYAGVPWFWSDQHDYTLQVAGLADTAAREVVRARPAGVEIWFGLNGGGRLVAAAAAGPGNSVARDIRLAEMLIARRAAPDPAALADPATALKSVLRSPVAS